MDALILAAGDGTRLNLPNTAKVLVKVWNVPLIEHVLWRLQGAGVTRAVIVVGHLGNQIKEKLRDNWRGVELVYRETDWYGDGVLKSVAKAKDALGDRFVLIFGDTIVGTDTMRDLVKKRADLVFGVVRSEHPDSAVALIKNRKLQRVGMHSEMQEWNAVLTGVCVCDKKAFFRAVNACMRKGRFDRPHAIQWMIEHKYKVAYYDMSDRMWLDIDTRLDLEDAEEELFDRAWTRRLSPRNRDFFRRVFNLSISLRVSRLVARTNITPNQLTTLGMLGFIAAGILMSAQHFVLGSIIAYSSAIIDAIDGKISRLKNQQSVRGAFYDSISDRISEFSVIGGLTIGLFKIYKSNYLLLLGFITLFGWTVRFYMKELFSNKIDDRTWSHFYIPRWMDLRARDIGIFAVLVFSAFGFPLLGLLYLAIFSNAFMLMRFFQCMRFLKKLDSGSG